MDSSLEASSSPSWPRGLPWSAARVLGVDQRIWVLTSIAMALTNGLDGVGRFTAVLFPVFTASGTLI
jgi:hypothetical protein